MIKKLIKLADYLDSKNFVKEANNLDRIIKKASKASSPNIVSSIRQTKVAAIIDDSLEDFQGYLRLQDGTNYHSAGKVNVDDEDGTSRLIEKFKEIRGAQIELVSTSGNDGGYVDGQPISFRRGKLYLPPFTLVGRGDNLLQLISNSPHWNVSDSEALNENFMNITEWPDLRLSEHTRRHLWHSLGKEAQKNPSGLQDFVDGFAHTLMGYRVSWPERNFLKDKSDSFIRGYYAYRYIQSENDLRQSDRELELHEGLYRIYKNNQLDKIAPVDKGLRAIRTILEKFNEIQNTEITKSNITSKELIRIGDNVSTLDEDIKNYMMDIIDIINFIKKADSLGVDGRSIGSKIDLLIKKLGSIHGYYHTDWVSEAEKLKHIAAANLEKAEMFREGKQSIIDDAEAKGEPIEYNYKNAIKGLDMEISKLMSRHQKAEEIFQN